MLNQNIIQQPQATLTQPFVPANFMATPGGGFRFGQDRINFFAHLATLTPAPRLNINFGDGTQFRVKNEPNEMTQANGEANGINQNSQKSKPKIAFGGHCFGEAKNKQNAKLQLVSEAAQSREIKIMVRFNHHANELFGISNQSQVPVFLKASRSEN